MFLDRQRPQDVERVADAGQAGAITHPEIENIRAVKQRAHPAERRDHPARRREGQSRHQRIGKARRQQAQRAAQVEPAKPDSPMRDQSLQKLPGDEITADEKK